MTPIPLSKYRALPEREKDALVAESVLGWKSYLIVQSSGRNMRGICPKELLPNDWTHEEENEVRQFQLFEPFGRDMPHFHSDLNACREMLNHLENDPAHSKEFALHKLGKKLFLLTGPQTLEECDTWYAAFTCLTATASELCEAALLAVGAVVEDEG